MDAPVAEYTCLSDADLVEEVEQLRLANAGLKALLKAQSRGAAKKTEKMRRERQRTRLYVREAQAAHRAMVTEMRRLRRKVSHFAVRAHAVEERASGAESLHLDAVERAEAAEEEARDEALAALEALSRARASAESAERLNEYYEASAAAARRRAAWAEVAVDKTKQLAALRLSRAERAEAEVGQLRVRAERAEAEAGQLHARAELAFAALGDWRRVEQQSRLRAAMAENELVAARRGEAEARTLAANTFDTQRAWEAGYDAALWWAENCDDPAETAQASQEVGPAAGSPAPAGGREAPTVTAQSRRARGKGSGDSTGSSGTVIRYEMDDDWVHDFELSQ